MTVLKIAPGIEKHFFMGSNDFARDPSISSRACKVYIYLISHQEGWQVTVRTVAKATGLGKNTVAAALRDLEEAGFIDRRQVKDASGQFAGTEYLIHRERQPRPQNGDTVEESGPRRNPESGVRNDQQEQGVSAGQSRYPENGAPENGQPESGSHKKTNSLKKNNGLEDQEEHPPVVPQGGQEAAPGGAPGNDYPAAFEDWYQRYPRKKAKRAALKAWEKATKRIDAQDLQDATDRFTVWCQQNQKDPQYIPYPASWLNADGWEDDLSETKAPSNSFLNAVRQRNQQPAQEVSRPAWADAFQLGGGQ